MQTVEQLVKQVGSERTRYVIEISRESVCRHVQDVANLVHQDCMRGPADLLFVSPATFVPLQRALDNYDGYARREGPYAGLDFADATYLGRVQNRFHLYVSHSMRDGQVLLARFGDGCSYTYENPRVDENGQQVVVVAVHYNPQDKGTVIFPRLLVFSDLTDEALAAGT